MERDAKIKKPKFSRKRKERRYSHRRASNSRKVYLIIYVIL